VKSRFKTDRRAGEQKIPSFMLSRFKTFHQALNLQCPLYNVQGKIIIAYGKMDNYQETISSTNFLARLNVAGHKI